MVHRHLVKVFATIDDDHTGYVTPAAVESVLASFGLAAEGMAEAQTMLMRAADGDGHLSYDAFVRCLLREQREHEVQAALLPAAEEEPISESPEPRARHTRLWRRLSQAAALGNRLRPRRVSVPLSRRSSRAHDSSTRSASPDRPARTLPLPSSPKRYSDIPPSAAGLKGLRTPPDPAGRHAPPTPWRWSRMHAESARASDVASEASEIISAGRCPLSCARQPAGGDPTGGVEVVIDETDEDCSLPEVVLDDSIALRARLTATERPEAELGAAGAGSAD